MNKIIEISVGMIYRRIGFDWMGPCRQEILFVLRNKKPFKEYFELPGGKLKENELPVDALKRELEEEIGIKQSHFSDTILHNSSKPIGVNYLNNITHHYKSSIIKINIFVVSIPEDYQLNSSEGKHYRFINPFRDNFKVIDSTYRIYRLFEIPTELFITSKNQEIIFNDEKSHFINGIRIKNYHKNSQQYTDNVLDAIKYIQDSSNVKKEKYLPRVHDRKLLIIDEEKSYDNLDIDSKNYVSGLHYNSSKLRNLNSNTLWKRKNNLQYISASCHNIKEIEFANKLNLDFILISPVLVDKGVYKKLNWDGFKKLTEYAHMPSLALGGISKDVKNFQSAINHNAYGIAGISGFWE